MSYIVGLTGQTGSGKTTACEMFEQAGFGIINCDLVAREVTTSGSSCLNQIVDFFGENILTQDNQLDRKKLAEIVFTDKLKLKKLNDIIFPYITNSILHSINTYSDKYDIVVLDAPTLFESNAHKLCNTIVAVIADENNIIDRITNRDSISLNAAKNRLNSQYKKEFFINNCKYVVENNDTKQNFINKISRIITDIKESCYEL